MSSVSLQLAQFPDSAFENTIHNAFEPSTAHAARVEIEKWSIAVGDQLKQHGSAENIDEFSILMRTESVRQFKKLRVHSSRRHINKENGSDLALVASIFWSILNAALGRNKSLVNNENIAWLIAMRVFGVASYAKAENFEMVDTLTQKTHALLSMFQQRLSAFKPDGDEWQKYHLYVCQLRLVEFMQQIRIGVRSDDRDHEAGEHLASILSEIESTTQQQLNAHNKRVVLQCFFDELKTLCDTQSQEECIGNAFVFLVQLFTSIHLEESPQQQQQQQQPHDLRSLTVKASIVLAFALHENNKTQLQAIKQCEPVSPECLTHLNEVIREFKGFAGEMDDDTIALFIDLLKIRCMLCLCSGNIPGTETEEYVLQPLKMEHMDVATKLEIVGSCRHYQSDGALACAALRILHAQYPADADILCRFLQAPNIEIGAKLAAIGTLASGELFSQCENAMKLRLATHVFNVCCQLFARGKLEQCLNVLQSAVPSLFDCLPNNSETAVLKTDVFDAISFLYVQLDDCESALQWMDKNECFYANAKTTNQGNDDDDQRVVRRCILKLVCFAQCHRIQEQTQALDAIERNPACSKSMLLRIARELMHRRRRYDTLALYVLERAFKFRAPENDENRQNTDDVAIDTRILRDIVELIQRVSREKNLNAANQSKLRDKLRRYFLLSESRLLPPAEADADAETGVDDAVLQFFAHSIWNFVTLHGGSSELWCLAHVLFQTIESDQKSERDTYAERMCGLQVALNRISAVRDCKIKKNSDENVETELQTCLQLISEAETALFTTNEQTTKPLLDLVQLAKFNCHVMRSSSTDDLLQFVDDDKHSFAEPQYIEMIRCLFTFRDDDDGDVWTCAIRIMERVLRLLDADLSSDKECVYNALMYRRLAVSWLNRKMYAPPHENRIEATKPYFEQLIDVFSTHSIAVSLHVDGEDEGEGDGDGNALDERLKCEWRWHVMETFNYAVYYVKHSQQNKDYETCLMKAKQWLSICEQIDAFFPTQQFKPDVPNCIQIAMETLDDVLVQHQSNQN